jgi:hypothetical protein
LGCFFTAKINQDPIPVVNICMDNSQITIADLDTIKNIIDLACTRGAFRGAEISQVGAVYDKLSLFLEAVIAQAKEQETSGTADSQPQGE